jgi:DNA-binding transcriptional MerR regulator
VYAVDSKRERELVLLKIGEFAHIGQISIKTLRHYDALGLLKPSRIDAESGYRFYEMGQLADVIRIQALKDCGFSLDEIAKLLPTHDAATIGELLRQRIATQQRFVEEEQARLQRMMARMQQLASGDLAPAYDVALKQTEPLTLVGLRCCVAGTEEIGPLAWMVLERLMEQGIVISGPLIHLYYESCPEEERLDLFVGVPVLALPSIRDDLRCERLAGGELVACVVYRGDYTGIGTAYRALNSWMAASGYHSIGPGREIYHWSPLHTQDAASYLTEIQYPVAR